MHFKNGDLSISRKLKNSILKYFFRNPEGNRRSKVGYSRIMAWHRLRQEFFYDFQRYSIANKNECMVIKPIGLMFKS